MMEIFALETKEGNSKLSYKEISDYWFNRTNKNKNKFLLIIINSDYTGSLVEGCNKS